MATYKVIQDIEAEDKFLGPLTLKQFVFGATCAVFLYLSFIAVSKHAAFLLAVFLPPAFLGGFLAVPWSKDQPTEVWVLAKLRFYFKPKRRIWDQSGVLELVTVTAPKIIERQLTNNLSQSEVSSRLKALAETIDSRGWAIKNSTMTAAAVDMDFSGLSDRLVSPSVLPKDVPDFDVNQIQDVMETTNNPIVDNFDQMIKTSNELRRDQSLEKMERIRRGEPLETIQQPEIHFTPPPAPDYTILPAVAAEPGTPPPIIAPLPMPVSLDEQQLSARLRAQSHIGDEAYSRLHTITPVSGTALPPLGQKLDGPPDSPPAKAKNMGTHEAKTDTNQSSSTMTTVSSPVILDLAQNDDLNVATIARQAKKSKEEHGSNEVVISLH